MGPFVIYFWNRGAPLYTFEIYVKQIAFEQILFSENLIKIEQDLRILEDLLIPNFFMDVPVV